jgi:hypothetical protein
VKTLTIPELARELGVTRQSLEAFRNANGLKPMGKKGASDLFYKSDFAGFGKSKRDKSEWHLLWEKERALKLQIENDRKRGELLDRGLVQQVFGNIYQIHRAKFLAIGPAYTDLICGAAKIKDDRVKTTIQKIIDDECYDALASIKAEINRLLEKMKSPEIVDAAPKKRSRKKPLDVSAKS